MEGSDSDPDSDSSPATVTKILRPSSANIQAVKSLFPDRYPHLTPQEQEQKYTDFRVRIFRIPLTSPSWFCQVPP
jgi:hypothetical protein